MARNILQTRPPSLRKTALDQGDCSTDENNDTPEVSPGIFWETLKAFLSGCVISYQRSRKKKPV